MGPAGDLRGETEGARASLDERGNGSIDGNVGSDVPCVRRYVASAGSGARFGGCPTTESIDLSRFGDWLASQPRKSIRCR